MSDREKTYWQLAATAVLFGVLLWMADLGKVSWDTVSGLVLMALGALLRHMLPVDNGAAPAAPGAGTQAGRSSIGVLMALAFLVSFVVSLTACAPMANSWYTAAEAKVVRDVKQTDDNVVQTLRDAWCGIPYGAVVRAAPEVADTVQALCGPLPSRMTAGQLASLLRSGVPALGIFPPGK